MIRGSPRQRPIRRIALTQRPKVSSDHLVRAWHHTYRLPTLTTNCSNTTACETTWCGFAREILRLAGLSTPVKAMGTAEYRRQRSIQ